MRESERKVWGKRRKKKLLLCMVLSCIPRLAVCVSVCVCEVGVLEKCWPDYKACVER